MRKPRMLAKGWRRAGVLTVMIRILTTTLLATAAPSPPCDNVIALDQLAAPEIHVLKGKIFHVQGLDIDDNYIYVTSVDNWSGRGFLHKFTLDGVLVGIADLTDGPRYHVGGISLDGESIWIPVAEYRSNSTTRIVQLDKTTLKPISSFIVKDHIGTLTLNATEVYGNNWDAKRFYIWDRNGKLLSSPSNPTQVAYQDLKFENQDLVASGVVSDHQTGTIDWLDPQSLVPRRRLRVGKMSNGLLWTREGMAIKGDMLYLMPNDGRDSSVDLYVFDLRRLKSIVQDCDGLDAGNCGPRPTTVAVR